jgi:hypothetical protein
MLPAEGGDQVQVLVPGAECLLFLAVQVLHVHLKWTQQFIMSKFAWTNEDRGNGGTELILSKNGQSSFFTTCYIL